MNQHFAFSAYANDFAEYENGDKINFTEVITNIGSHYDATQSHFICPVAGKCLLRIASNVSYHEAVFAFQNRMQCHGV